MAYTITVTNGSPITIATGDSDTSTSLTLIGKNFPNYGQLIGQNLVDLMQNFAGTSEPNGILTGQLWYDTSTNLLKIYNGADFDILATSTVSTNQPTAANAGDLWYDTVNQVLKVYSGAAWITVGPSTFSTPIVADNIADISNTVHQVARIAVDGANVAVLSSQGFTAKTSYAGITSIIQGLYINGSLNIASNAVISNNLNVSNNLTVTGVANLTAASAKYADLAEYYSSDKEYEPGTVVMIADSTDVTISNSEDSHKVVGVTSSNPAYIMNNELTGIKVAVALQGRVPCKVIGNIMKGDLLTTSSTSGAAKSNKTPKPGTIIGKALANYSSPDIGIIEIIVGKH